MNVHAAARTSGQVDGRLFPPTAPGGTPTDPARPPGGARSFGVWWRLLRPFTLTASITPVLVGTGLAAGEQTGTSEISMLLFAAMLVAAMAIQAATNMFNEYYDFKRGLDTSESIGIAGAIVRDGVSPKTVLRSACLLYGIAFVLGLYICWVGGWPVAVIGSVSMAVGYAYTGGPRPIAYTPYGELASALFMGPNIVLISYHIQTGSLSWTGVLVSIPVMLLVGMILLGNNIRDMDGDRERGRRTLAIVAGRRKAIRLLQGVVCGVHALTAALIAAAVLTPWALLTLLTVPLTLRVCKSYLVGETPAELNPAVKQTAALHALHGLLLSIGLFLA